MRIVNNSESIQVKSDELTWIFICGGLFLAFMTRFVTIEESNQKIAWLLLSISFVVWFFLIWKSENTRFSILKEQKIVILNKYWFHKENLFIESRLSDFSQVKLEENPDRGSYSLRVSIDGEKYSLFNHFSSSNKVKRAYHLLSEAIEQNKPNKKFK